MSLKVWYKTKLVGELFYLEKKLSFIYASTWLEDKKSFELSFALPLQNTKFGHDETRSFFIL